MEFKHVPVLLNETVDYLQVKAGGIYVDCTLGGGGHSLEILNRLKGTGTLIGIDQDLDAIKAAKEKLKDFSNVIYVHDNFYNIDKILQNLEIPSVDAIMMDLGVSSFQLDEAQRGFSYMKDAPLDMRMDTQSQLSAYYVVNNYTEEQLLKVLWEYGEEKFARRIVHKILEQRAAQPIKTTGELAKLIKESIPARFQKQGHPAKKTFQAIRIEVNKELVILDKSIQDSVNHLNVKGRIAVITFQSLEDRIIKNKFRSLENPCICPRDFPVCACGRIPSLKVLTRKPIEPSEAEMESNPRSKSAKLRVAQKI